MKKIFLAIFSALVAPGVIYVIPVAAAVGTVVFEMHSTQVDSSFWGRGNGGAVDKIAQKYTPSADQVVCAVEHQIAKIFNPSDRVVLSVYAGGTAPETGRVIASSTLAAASVPANTATHTAFPFEPCFSMQGASTYWFVFTRTVLSSGNGYISAYRTSNEYGSTSYWQYNGFDPQGWQENLSREWSLRLVGPEPKRNEPVIIVPGILGSKLNRVSDGAEVWPNVAKMKASSGDGYLDDLMLPENGSASILAGDVVRNTTTTILGFPFETVYLKNLISSLEVQEYVEQKDLFVVPYDWRLDLSDSTARLDAVIQTALANSPTGKVNIIAHSLGGLLVKEYIRSSGNSRLINKLILAGVPNLGAPKAAKILSYGDNMGFRFATRDILNPLQLQKIAQHMPAVYELLPSRKYLQAVGSYIADYRSGSSFRRLDFDSTAQFLKTAGRVISLVDRGADFHSGVDDLTALASSVYLLSGCKQSNTIGDIRLYDKNEFRLGIVPGDGTVPLLSANAVASTTRRYFIDTNHAGLVRGESALALINSILTETPDAAVTGVSQEIASCEDTRSTLLFSSHSPVELHVYDSQERHTGPVADGDIEFGIPGSEYDQLSDNTFIFVPAGDTYRVVAQATGSGTATLDAELYVGSTLTAKASYLAVPLASEKTSAQVSISDVVTAQALQLDVEGDGTVDAQLPPTIAGSAAAAADEAPPVITISPSLENNYSRSGQLSLAITIEDVGSGVATSSILLDGAAQTNSTTLDLFFTKLGLHKLVVAAYDNVGNFSQVEKEFTVSSDVTSTINDLSRVISLGWAAKKTASVDVVAELTEALDSSQSGEAMGVLNKQCGNKQLSTQAYQVLKEDIEWLTSH